MKTFGAIFITLALVVMVVGLVGQTPNQILPNGMLGGISTPATCSVSVAVPFYNTRTTEVLDCIGGVYVARNGWFKYSVVAIANGANGCANAGGCWQVNGVKGANKAAALTQDIALFTLPARGYIEKVRFKTTTAFTGGTTSVISDVGTSGTAGYFVTGLTYNLKTAVGDTNLSNPILTAIGSDTAASRSITFRVTNTVDNISAITTGSAVDVWVKWGVLPR